MAVALDDPSPYREPLRQAVEAGGGTLVSPTDAEGLIWISPHDADAFPAIRAAAPNLTWVQLPYAGITPFLPHLDDSVHWTCGKGVYAEPVAEHALALTLAGFRNLHGYARAHGWSERVGTNLLGARVTILGAGGITDSLLRLLGPWGCSTTVVRRRDEPHPGAHRTVRTDRMLEALTGADVAVVAWALTPTTTGLLDANAFAAMPDTAWLVNVGRGRHVVTADLVDALRGGSIGGAALDVTDPEPLPSDHPLWTFPNCIITPHTANTLQMGIDLYAERVTENVRRFIAGEELIGPIDLAAGY
ncbi:MAG: hydroxyacid dehydrogenase [Acidimicrobiales bacterium]|nr:hydroxyacid dehydrogenase [Acidimicrobiales bacterium]